MARVYTAERLPLGCAERGFLRLVGNAREQDVAGLRDVGARLQRPLLRPPLRAAARAGPPVPQSRQARRCPVPHLAEHGGQLRHEHELAVLRRRVHDVVPHPDGGARGAELRLRRCRDGRSRRGRTRDRTPLARGDRQLLAGPLPLLRLHPVAARGRPRGDPHLTGRRPDLPRRTRPRRRSRARSRRSHAAPPRRRSRSSSSGRTAAGSTTRTPRCRSRTRTA